MGASCFKADNDDDDDEGDREDEDAPLLIRLTCSPPRRGARKRAPMRTDNAMDVQRLQQLASGRDFRFAHVSAAARILQSQGKLVQRHYDILLSRLQEDRSWRSFFTQLERSDVDKRLYY